MKILIEYFKKEFTADECRIIYKYFKKFVELSDIITQKAKITSSEISIDGFLGF